MLGPEHPSAYRGCHKLLPCWGCPPITSLLVIACLGTLLDSYGQPWKLSLYCLTMAFPLVEK